MYTGRCFFEREGSQRLVRGIGGHWWLENPTPPSSSHSRVKKFYNFFSRVPAVSSDLRPNTTVSCQNWQKISFQSSIFAHECWHSAITPFEMIFILSKKIFFLPAVETTTQAWNLGERKGKGATRNKWLKGEVVEMRKEARGQTLVEGNI